MLNLRDDLKIFPIISKPDNLKEKKKKKRIQSFQQMKTGKCFILSILKWKLNLN